MMRIFKALLVLVVLLVVAVLGYAYLGDLSPNQTGCQHTGDAGWGLT